jgi:hypothetical protein
MPWVVRPARREPYQAWDHADHDQIIQKIDQERMALYGAWWNKSVADETSTFGVGATAIGCLLAFAILGCVVGGGVVFAWQLIANAHDMDSQFGPLNDAYNTEMSANHTEHKCPFGACGAYGWSTPSDARVWQDLTPGDPYWHS